LEKGILGRKCRKHTCGSGFVCITILWVEIYNDGETEKIYFEIIDSGSEDRLDRTTIGMDVGFYLITKV